MKVIGLRQFLRGEYRRLAETTVVTLHGRPVATWIPHRGHGMDWSHLSEEERGIVGAPGDYDWENPVPRSGAEEPAIELAVLETIHANEKKP